MRVTNLTEEQKIEANKAFEFLFKKEKIKETLNNVETPEEKFNEIFDYFTWYLLGICGCGCADESIKCVRNYINIVKINHEKSFDEGKEQLKEIFGVYDVCSDPVLQFMSYVLDDKGLTNHGSNISGAWITNLGKILSWCYNIYINDLIN